MFRGVGFDAPNCFNPETWDFNSGKEWTPEVEDKFIELASRPYIKRISLLGGECLADENLDGVLNLINKIRLSLPQKKTSGYTVVTNINTSLGAHLVVFQKRDITTTSVEKL